MNRPPWEDPTSRIAAEIDVIRLRNRVTDLYDIACELLDMAVPLTEEQDAWLTKVRADLEAS